MNTSEDSERIDDWASRLIDGDIILDDVDADARDAVAERAQQFRVVRETLRRSRGDTPTNTELVVSRVLSKAARGRRARVYALGLVAAASVATIVGVAVSSTDRTVPQDIATMAAGTPVDSAGAVDAKTKLAPSLAPADGQASASMESTTSDICPDERRPTIIPLAYIDDEAVEIHWSAADGVVVYRISDCSVVLTTTP